MHTPGDRHVTRTAVERLLDAPGPDDRDDDGDDARGLPEGVRALDTLLDQARAPGHPDELAGEEDVVAAFRTVHANAATQQLPIAYPPRGPDVRVFPWWLTLKAAAVLVAALSVGFGFAGSGGGTLPWSTSNPGQPPQTRIGPSSRNAPPGVAKETTPPQGAGASAGPAPPSSAVSPGSLAASNSRPTASATPTTVEILDAFQVALAEEAAAGRIPTKFAQTLQDLASKAREGFTSTDPTKARKPLNDLAQKITQGGETGTIDGAAADRLMNIIAPLIPTADTPGPAHDTASNPGNSNNTRNGQ
jgi:hypothetical protein